MSIFYLKISLTSLWASESTAQSTTVKLSVKSGTIASVFDQIRAQTNMEFFYNTNSLDVTRRVEADLRQMSLEQILDTVLGDRYTYSIQDHYVMIAEKKRQPAPEVQVPASVIRGTVRNEQGQPVVGASVSIRGTAVGVATGKDGSFILQVPHSDRVELYITFIGLQPVTVVYTGQQSLNIVMKEDATSIDDVVVTGFFPRRKEGFAGTVTTLTKEDLQKVSTANIFATISTLDAGFRINENNVAGSNPNVLPDFTIRGKGSFQAGSTQPLFILDGFEVSVETVFDLDVNRIETITLLKDASATILYGSRAANGVVVIETTVPKTGEIRVSYSFKPTVSFADLTGYDLMNAAEKLEYERLAGLYEHDTAYDLYEGYDKDQAYYDRYKNVTEGVDTYWLSQPVRNTFSQQHSLRIDGGVQQITYAIDAGYNQYQGIMKKSGRDRTNIGVTLGYRIRDKVTIQNKVSYGYTHAYDSPYGSFSTYAEMNPYERIYDDDGKLIPILLNGKANPLYDAKLPNRSIDNTETLNEQLFVDWVIRDNLRLRGQFGLTKTNINGDKYTSPYSATYILTTTYNSEIGMMEYTPPEKRGELGITNGNGLNTSGNITLTYNKLLADKHLIYAGIGGEFSTANSDSNGYILTGFADDRFSDPAYAMQYKEGTRATSSESTTRAMGVFGNLNYIYDNRYFADFSFRIDGSSAFGSDKKYAPFWALGAGWNIHNESFWSKDTFIDQFRLRVSYGVTGNQNFSAYQAKTTYQLMTSRMYWNAMPAVLMGYGNTDLKWQSTYATNIGLDFGLAKRRLTISFNYYDKLTKNTVTEITVAPSIGLSGDSYTANLGEISNRGYEFNVNAVLVRNEAKLFEWTVLFQGAYNKNKLVKISNKLKTVNDTNNLEKYIPGFVYEEGQSMEAIFAVKSLGIDPTTGQEIFVKKDGTFTNTWDPADKVYAGVAEPKLFGNISTNVEYRNWNLNMVFGYSFGGDYYNQTLSSRVEGADPAYNADRRVLNDRWINPGDYALYRNIREYTSNYISTRFVQRDNMFKLTSISLSYDISKSFLKQYGLNLLRISGYANDLFRVSSVREERGLSYPFARSFVFELKVMF